MGRPKGGKNRKWTNEERLKYVLLCEEELLSPEYVERNYGVSAGTLRGWIKAELYSERWHKKYVTAKEMIVAYVNYFNNQRPAYALQYKSPVQFRSEQGFL